jgi:hypothetical protein
MDIIYKGHEHEILLPSGRKVTIRENNGDDEELLSKVANAKGNLNMRIYLSSIIVQDSETKPDKLTPVEHMGNMKCRDAYYLMYKQRLINLGPQLTFEKTCALTTCKHKTEYDMEVDEFDRDLTLNNEEFKAKMKETNSPYSDYIVENYPSGNDSIIEKVLSSGKKIRFKILTLKLEYWRLEQPFENQSNNTIIYERELEYWDENKWVIAKNLKMFSSRDLKEIRGLIDAYDSRFQPLVEYECEKCKSPGVDNLFQMNDFFYPVEKY